VQADYTTRKEREISEYLPLFSPTAFVFYATANSLLTSVIGKKTKNFLTCPSFFSELKPPVTVITVSIEANLPGALMAI